MLMVLLAYTMSYSWPTLGYDAQRSSYQAVPGANLSAAQWSVKWRVAMTFSMQRTCGAVLEDVRGDYPGQEVILNDGANVQCRDGNTGNVIWSVSHGGDLAPNSTPAVGDVTGDGVPDVLFCHQQPGILYCLRGSDGYEQWRDTLAGGQVFAPVVLADVDGDGLDEVIVGTMFSNNAYCYDGDGSQLWQSDALGNVNASVTGLTAGDITGSSAPEILVSIQDGVPSNSLICLDNNGHILWKFPGGTFPFTMTLTTPALGDVNGDGNLDVVIGRTDNGHVYALNGSGSTIWDYTVPSNPKGDQLVTYYQNLTTYDVDGDGRAEVFFGVGGGDTSDTDQDTTHWQSYFIGLDNNGSELFTYMIDYWTYDGGGALCDIDNDGDVEFMKTADDGFFYVFDAQTGNLEWRYDWFDEDNVTEWTADPPVAVGDIDGDACSEVVIIGAGLGGDMLTALDGPGTSCMLYAGGEEHGSSSPLPHIAYKPGTGALTLKVVGFKDAKALVWDASGRRVAEMNLRDDNWSSVPVVPGIYFVKAYHRDVVMKAKVLVE